MRALPLALPPFFPIVARYRETALFFAIPLMLTPNGYPGSICENAYQLLVSGQLKVMASCTNWLREFPKLPPR